MSVITLTTDWRKNDYYVGSVKGKILSRDITTVIVDITHQITSFNVMQAAFVLRNCYKEFPKGTIHIVGVNSTLTQKRALLIVEKDDQYFLCSDSGFPGLAFPNQGFNVFKVDSDPEKSFASSSLDLFVDVAYKLIRGEAADSIGKPSDNYIKQLPLRPTIDTDLINGSVVYIDSYANAITNITREIFERIGKGKDFEIFVQSNHYIIEQISNTYSDVSAGELIALFNSANLLEIAISNGPAADLLNLSVNAVIRIRFSKSKDKNRLILSGD